MKFFRALGTLILCLLMLLSTALTLACGLFSFLILNPDYYKAAVPTTDYCDSLKDRIGENLDHVAILYGLEEGVLKDLITDADITSYTSALTDALFSSETTDSIAVPDYPAERFASYLKEHSAYSEKAVLDFSEDCSSSVTDDLSSVNVSILISGFSKLRTSKLALLSPILCLAALLLTVVLSALILVIYSDAPRTGRLCVTGGIYSGITLLFVPVMQFWLFDYIGRLNVSVSAFRTILTGYLSAALYGCLSVLGVAFILSFVFLLLSCMSAARTRKSKR